MGRLSSAMLAVAALFATTPLNAQRVVPDAPDDYAHVGTGTVFPIAIGDFRRVTVREYSADGRDASAGYDLVRDDRKLATVTVYVYPAPDDVPLGTDVCRMNIDGTRAAIEQTHPDATMIAENPVSSPVAAIPAPGRHVSYTMTAVFDGRKAEVASDSWVFCPTAGHWLVKYRVTRLRSPDVTGDVASFLKAFAWSPAVGR